MLSIKDACEYRFPWQKGATIVQRSSSCPYLWTRLGEHTLWYVLKLAHSSICKITWVYRSLLKNARNQLRDELLSRCLQDEPDEDESDDV